MRTRFSRAAHLIQVLGLLIGVSQVVPGGDITRLKLHCLPIVLQRQLRPLHVEVGKAKRVVHLRSHGTESSRCAIIIIHDLDALQGTSADKLRFKACNISYPLMDSPNSRKALSIVGTVVSCCAMHTGNTTTQCESC